MQDNNLIVLNGQICAKFYYLVSLGISEGTINNGISKNKNGKSFKWDMKKKGIFRYIYVESIPKYTYDKYNLDKPIKRFKDILSKPQRPQTPFLVTRFKIIADSKWNIYDGHYQQFHPNHQLIQSFAKTHAIFQEIIQLSDCKKFTLKELYKNYKKIPLDIPLYYRAKSYTTFVKKIKQARMDGIDNVLPHKLLKVEGNSKKFTTYWKNLTLKLYSDPMKYTKTSIWEKVNHERHLMDLDHLSYQTIQSFLNSDEVINITTKKATASEKAAPKKAAAPSKGPGRGTRYTPAQKAKVLNFVDSVNAKKGRGGAAAASRKFKISQITIGQWVKKAGAPAGAKKATSKASTKGAAKSSGNGFAAKLRRLADVHEAIGKKEAELNALQQEYASLKKAL